MALETNNQSMFTIICIYNNREIMHKYIEKSVKEQNILFKTIFFDNTIGKYHSMAKAYNSLICKAKTQWVVMAHQDMELYPSFLEDALKQIENLNNIGLVGVAGCKQGKNGVYSNIKYGPNLENAGEESVSEPIIVQTIDECLMIARTDVIINNPFDEITCDNWHLYGVEKCIDLSLKGYKNYVIDARLFHHSKEASMNDKYFTSLFKLLKKYRDDCGNINTTCGNWSNTNILYIYKLWGKEVVKKALSKIMRQHK